MVNNRSAPGRPPLTQKLLIAWGKDGDQAISDAVWLLEIDGNDHSSLKWSKVYLLYTMLEFSAHTYALDIIYSAAIL